MGLIYAQWLILNFIRKNVNTKILTLRTTCQKKNTKHLNPWFHIKNAKSFFKMFTEIILKSRFNKLAQRAVLPWWCCPRSLWIGASILHFCCLDYLSTISNIQVCVFLRSWGFFYCMPKLARMPHELWRTITAKVAFLTLSGNFL